MELALFHLRLRLKPLQTMCQSANAPNVSAVWLFMLKKAQPKLVATRVPAPNIETSNQSIA